MMKEEKQQNQATQNDAKIQEEQKPTFATRRERRKFKKQEENANVENEETQKVRWVQIRLIPIWLRIILVLLLLFGVALMGLYLGYSVIGDGNPSDVLKKETWTHISDIISGKE